MLKRQQQCFRNSDEKSPNPEECEHDGPIVTTPHEGKTTQDELGDLRWLMISKKAQRSHLCQRNHKSQDHCMMYKVSSKVKNQNLRATRSKECLKNKNLISKVTSLRGRLLGIQIFL